MARARFIGSFIGTVGSSRCANFLFRTDLEADRLSPRNPLLPTSASINGLLGRVNRRMTWKKRAGTLRPADVGAERPLSGHTSPLRPACDHGARSPGGSANNLVVGSASQRRSQRTALGGGFSAANLSFKWSMMRSTTAGSEITIPRRSAQARTPRAGACTP
jgi:hypothetical protein